MANLRSNSVQEFWFVVQSVLKQTENQTQSALVETNSVKRTKSIDNICLCLFTMNGNNGVYSVVVALPHGNFNSNKNAVNRVYLGNPIICSSGAIDNS
jgi:delta-aminolevulinic acid dehydratase/porphobilinogen synthase